MPYSLKGKVVLVTGGSRGLGAAVATQFAAEGSHVGINYVSNKSAADELVFNLEKNYTINCCAIRGDAANADDNARITRKTKPGDLYDLSHEEWNKCWAINVMSHLHLVQAAAPIFKQNVDGGVYLMTSSIAGISNMGSSMGYAVTKAAGLQVMKLVASSQGPKLRINAVLPGLLLTEWGQDFGPAIIDYLNKKSILKHETYIDDCAKVFVDLAQNTSITGQQIVVDSGLLQGPAL